LPATILIISLFLVEKSVGLALIKMFPTCYTQALITNKLLCQVHPANMLCGLPKWVTASLVSSTNNIARLKNKNALIKKYINLKVLKVKKFIKAIR
jgi:hypothetical protein